MKPLPPVRPTMCATCPFRPGSKYAYLCPDLTERAITAESRICHSTGSSAIYNRTGRPLRVCRGARDVQLNVFHRLGFLEAPTDACWTAKLNAIKSKGKAHS